MMIYLFQKVNIFHCPSYQPSTDSASHDHSSVALEYRSLLDHAILSYFLYSGHNLCHVGLRSMPLSLTAPNMYLPFYMYHNRWTFHTCWFISRSCRVSGWKKLQVLLLPQPVFKMLGKVRPTILQMNSNPLAGQGTLSLLLEVSSTIFTASTVYSFCY